MDKAITPSQTTKEKQMARQYVEDYIHASSSGLARDYALAFIADVNWHEIAAHYQEETV